MPQSCDAGNFFYFAQTVAVEVQHLEIQHIDESPLWVLSISNPHLKSMNTYSDLTEDIGSGHVKKNFFIQAQQPGLRFQHRFHVEDFLVQDGIIGRNTVSICVTAWQCRLFLVLITAHQKALKDEYSWVGSQLSTCGECCVKSIVCTVCATSEKKYKSELCVIIC